MENFYLKPLATSLHGLRRLTAAVLLLLFAVTAEPAAAGEQDSGKQQPTIQAKGRVVDTNGIAIAGAAVTVKGGSAGGTISDAQGAFTLRVRKGDVLHVSFLGFQAREIAVTDASPLTIRLAEETHQVEDVVVVGYGVQKKESVLGAISQVNNEQLVNSGTTNITNAIAGKLSGVTTIQTGGQPGNNDANIFIRGVSSWNGSTPLVLVDGVERSFADIDPNEVASLSVLKDASATAVFGAKGANGVIIVTTRTGSTGKPKMNISLSYGLDFPTMIPDHIGSAQTAELLNVALKNAQSYGSMIPRSEIEEYARPSSRINSIRYPDNDWFDIAMRRCAQTINANYNVSGGSQRVKYFLSLGYSHEGSIFKDFSEWSNANFRYDRINYRSNLDFDVTRSTKLSVKVGGVLGIKDTPTDKTVSGMFNMMYSASPMMYPAYYPAWVLEEIPDTDYPDASGGRLSSPRTAYFGNIRTSLSTGEFEQTTDNKLYTDINFEQKLDFITKGLSVKANVSLSTYYSRISQTATNSNPTFYIDWNRYDAGDGNPWIYSAASEHVYENTPYAVTRGAMQNNYYVTFYWEGALNYNRTFGDHTVTALALFNQRENVKGTAFPYHSQGVVGRVTYDYKHKYLFECNLGYTGSEQFSPENRYGFFPSVAIGWVPSQERFWKEAMPWWSKLKIRYSDGLVGSDSGSRWLYFSDYVKGGDSYIYEGAAANAVAQWEEARKRDLGIEMGWLNNRLTLNLDLFDEKRTNMLVKPNVTMLVGTSYKEVNRGSMKKHGIDIELGWADKTPTGFGYNLTAMVSLNENRITNYEDAPYAPEYQKTAGKPYKGQTDGVSIVDSGYFESIDDIHNYPAYTTDWNFVNVGAYKYLDYSADGRLSVEDLHAIAGSQYPPVVCSFRAGFDYKGFEFSMLWYANLGKWVEYNKSWEIEFNKGDYRITHSQLDYWRPDNRDANHATLVYGGTSGHPMYMWAGGSGDAGAKMMLEGRTWRKADYLSLREVYLAYTFNAKRLRQKVGFRSLSLYLTANNLLTFTPLIEGDPASTTFTTGFYPQMTSLKLGVKIGF
ncbi:MAG: TonB-dependent receptor [Alistipes sp.]|uniref:TonB-dependent receptor n=2 Tax=Alistipes TaxID=239759 RepID=A0ABV1GX81_9BACT|nr:MULTISPECIES: TonB-dependent receptor [Alistipes]MBD9302322.1 TonB-dependent receptor [Alistipes senegalensis]MBQ7893539.1 TonB-dependent receptor [Alistipes sp.]MBR2217399.1 TonB-dependent receptor [Alistipes sp.]MBS5525264.1 TonB-dependent receptor [Alistipes sp.]